MANRDGYFFVLSTYTSHVDGFDANFNQLTATAGNTATIYYKKMAKDTAVAVPAGYTTWMTLDPNSAPPTTPVGAWTDVHILEKIVKYTS
jgi:hypothetical protein